MHKTNGAIPAPSQDPRFGEEFFDKPKFNEAEKGAPHFEQERRDEDVASERKREKTTEEFSGRLRPDASVLVGEDNVFPIDAFPAVIRDLAESFAETWDTAPETLAMCMLTVTSAAIGKWAFALSDKAKPVRGNIFTYLSLRASGKKSVAFDEAMEPVIKYNELRRESHKEVCDQLKAELDAIREGIKTIKDNKNGIDEEAKKELAKLYRKERIVEEKLRFWNIQSSDFSIEFLIQKGIRTRSVFIASDEAKIVHSIIMGRYSDGNSSEPTLCKFYSGGSHERERVGNNESESATGIVGTTLLLGQPHITRAIFEDQTMKESGFVPRFLFAAVPSELIEEDGLFRKVNERARSTYQAAILNLFQRYWGKWEELLGELVEDEEGNLPTPPKEEELMVRFSFSQDALSAFRAFRNSVVRSKYAKKIETLDSVIDRLKENAMRVAIVLHVLKNIPTETGTSISVGTASEAIAIVRWSFGQYLEFSHASHEDHFDQLDRDILSYVKKKGEVDRRDVQRKFKAYFNNVEKAESALERLVRRGKLKPERPEKLSETGRPKRTVYRIA